MEKVIGMQPVKLYLHLNHCNGVNQQIIIFQYWHLVKKWLAYLPACVGYKFSVLVVVVVIVVGEHLIGLIQVPQMLPVSIKAPSCTRNMKMLT